MSQPPGAGHGQPFTPGYGAASAGGADRPATLGIVGLTLVGIQLIVVIAGNLLGSVVVVTVWSTSDSMGQLSVGGFGGLSAGHVLILMASGAIGLAGWIVGIVATVTNRGRAFGIAAIVVGAATWVIAAAMMFGALLFKSMG